MADEREQVVTATEPVPASQNPAAPTSQPAEAFPGADGPAAVDEVVNGKLAGWHAEAGRKGAFRLRELIQEGRLYEKEHGLTRGRQRIRQLIQEGKLYEQEHGLRPSKKRGRGPRLSQEQVLKSFFQALLRVAKPSLRPRLARMMETLDQG